MVVWRGAKSRCGVYFQTCSRTYSDRLPVVVLILHSAGGGCLEVGYLFQTFPH